MRYTPLADADARALPQLASWTVANGTISREFALESYANIPDFIRDVVALADQLDHHPDIDIRYPDRVVVKVSTHAINGLSMHDVDLAMKIDSLLTRP